MPFVATWMDLEIIISEISQIYDIMTNVIYLMMLIKKLYKRLYLQNRNRLTDIENKHHYQKGKLGER